MDIGFMQGRLCDRVDGKIQAFPWRDWEQEFEAAQRLGLRAMEWTLDQERLYENPLMTTTGRSRILALMAASGVRIISLTGDCFMQAPFYKCLGSQQQVLLQDLRNILEAAFQIGISYVLIPLVDNGSLTCAEEEVKLLNGLVPLRELLISRRMKIVFESDFTPEKLADFIRQFPEDAFGINYDIGNSASLGYEPTDEIARYGHRILNVHVKDRQIFGTTVPLGTGNANFPKVFRALRYSNYAGNFILQTARAEDDDHSGVIARYRDMTIKWWKESGLRTN